MQYTLSIHSAGSLTPYTRSFSHVHFPVFTARSSTPRRLAQLQIKANRQTGSPRSARAAPPAKWEPDVIVNDDIQAPQVRLINVDKEMMGIVSREEALALAEDLGVDVICIAPDADPPVCRLLEYSKYRYELEKAGKEAKKKQKSGRVEIKELKLRPNTDVHDYQVRLRAAEKFIAKGNKVKLSLQFRGREMEFKGIGQELMQKFLDDLGESAVVESGPAMIGRSMCMVIMPKKTI